MRVPLASTSSPPSIEVSPASIRSRVVLPAPLRPAMVMPLAALELERDAAQQRLAGHVLGEIGCDEDGHDPHGRLRRHAIRTDRADPRARARRPRGGGRDGDHDPRRDGARPVEVRQGLRHEVRAQERQAGARAHARLLRRRGRLHARRARDRQARARPSGLGAGPPLAGAGGHGARSPTHWPGASASSRPSTTTWGGCRTPRSRRTSSRSIRRSSRSPSSGACRSRCRTCAAWCSARSARASA